MLEAMAGMAMSFILVPCVIGMIWLSLEGK
jgi:hypothetical protein